MDTFTDDSEHFQQVFIRDKWYPFGPAEINAYLGTPNHQAVPYPNPHLLAAALTHNKAVTWPQNGLKSLQLTTVYSVLLCLASANWIPAVRQHFVSDQLVALLYKIRNGLPFNLGDLIFSHIIKTFLKKKEAKVHLPYPSLIFGVLQDHGFKPYKDEVVTPHDNVYLYDDRLTQRDHYDDRASLSLPPAIAMSTPLVSAPATSEDTVSASLPGSRPVPKEPHSVASQLATISGLGNLRDAQLKEIARMEEIHAQILADTGAASSGSDYEDDDDDSDSGTPSAR
ncbi:PREDICTED: uncharacterized protein LOC109178078 [Ipomoea nil]|uniref:uncharacterized protein LOC109178078 n=1 Tax=Ipomoea nil TaxID=35883 RepID=UPI000900ED82|nr:PREDICTED: uncharacterized protein LOC109178078 [Ipomoea nil]